MAGPPKSPRRKLGLAAVAAICALVVVGMVGVAYASVPLYRAFCQATGFNGTPRRVETGPGGAAGTRTVQVRFDTNTRDLPWTFTPDQTTQQTTVGRTSMAYFSVTNNGDTPLTGRASYNIAPESAATYFLKLQCFCFSDQTIPAHTTEHFPVVYYVDKKFASDPDTSALQELTLSYTFYPAPDAKTVAWAANGADGAKKG